MAIHVEPAEQPAWQLTPLCGAAAAVSVHPSGRWSIVRASGSIEGESLDEVLCRALQTAVRRGEDGSPHRPGRARLQ